MGAWVTLLEYCTSKPPIIVFFISVMAFALTLAGFSISIELSKGKLINPDIRSWNSFYNSISQLGICFNKKNNSNILTQVLKQPSEPQEVNGTKFSFMSEMSISMEGDQSELLSMHGFVKAEDLGYLHTNDEIEIIITTFQSDPKKSQACLTVSGQFDVLPNAKTPKPLCNHVKSSSMEEVSFMPYWKAEDKLFCTSGQFGKLSIKEKEELNVYISEMDTSLIQLHILFTSSVLCVTMAAILLCAMFGRHCKREKNSVVEIDKTTLIPGR